MALMQTRAQTIKTESPELFAKLQEMIASIDKSSAKESEQASAIENLIEAISGAIRPDAMHGELRQVNGSVALDQAVNIKIEGDISENEKIKAIVEQYISEVKQQLAQIKEQIRGETGNPAVPDSPPSLD